MIRSMIQAVVMYGVAVVAPLWLFLAMVGMAGIWQRSYLPLGIAAAIDAQFMYVSGGLSGVPIYILTTAAILSVVESIRPFLRFGPDI